MIDCNLILIGKLKEKAFLQLSEIYETRLSALCRFSVIELPAVRLCDTPSAAEIRQALEKEGKEILARIEKLRRGNAFTIAMCIEGKQQNSKQFADTLARAWTSARTTNIIIGSSYGLSDTVKQQVDLQLSMSAMTFPHKLARIMILEQIYRAFTIQQNRKYDK